MSKKDLTTEIAEAKKIINDDYDLTLSEWTRICDITPRAYEAVPNAFVLGYLRGTQAQEKELVELKIHDQLRDIEISSALHELVYDIVREGEDYTQAVIVKELFRIIGNFELGSAKTSYIESAIARLMEQKSVA